MKATPQVFFTADTHYHHRNLVRGESKWANKSGCRDFDTLEENDIKLIEGINSTVGVDDVLFHLGDFSFGDIKYYKEFRSQIKCQNIY